MRHLIIYPLVLLTACASGVAEEPYASPAPAGPAATAATIPPELRPGIAVFPFTSGGSIGRNREDLDALEVGLQQLLLTELAQNPNLRIVERTLLREMLEEQNLATAGRVDANTAAQLGRLVGARYAVTGSFTDVSNDFRIDGRIVDVETGEVLRSSQVRGRRNQLYGLVHQLSTRVMADMNLPPLAANVQAERGRRPIPEEAVVLYSRAVMLQDHGQTDRAIELYRQISQRFPQMTEAREALRQLAEG